MFAGAAFTDSADIKVDADVVDTLVSLGIVEGFEDGSFQPNGTVTRAQMAKMIYVLRTGNSESRIFLLHPVCFQQHILSLFVSPFCSLPSFSDSIWKNCFFMQKN